MTKPLPILTDQEVLRSAPGDEEAGFGSLATPGGHLPLKAMDVRGRIDGLLAEIEVSQTFVNVLDEPLEATYIFPLPDRAAVTRFRMEAAGRVIEGSLKERAAAREEYERAIRAGQRGAITEEERPGTFTMRVGNIMPGEKVVVLLTLIQPLPYDDGELTFRFPLVVAPRYIPGNPLPGPSVGAGAAADTDAVPDASRITPPVLLPGFPNPVRLSLAVDIAPSPLDLREFRSSLHSILTEESEHVRRITLHPGERLNRDFVLRCRVGADAVKTSLALCPDAQGDEGTFVLTVVPPAEQLPASRARDVAFVLDRSGSMGGWKIVAARRAIARMVDTLTEGDRFNVYAFDNVVETVSEFEGLGLVPANNRNRFRAVEFLARMEARGGTEMAQPLDRAVCELAGTGNERDRILVLVTDGQVGNEDQILRTLGKRVENVRIFTLGIDRAVNEGFLRRLAMLGGGCCEIVESESRLDEVMDRIHRRIGVPVLTDVRLEAANLHIESDSIVPTRMPDLFDGAPLCIMGRYRGSRAGSVRLEALDAAGGPWSETPEPQISANRAIAATWARGFIRALEDRYILGRPELEKRIVDTSLRFGVLCRFTAFVAVDKSEVVNPGGTVHQIVQPVEAPEGWGPLVLGQTAAACSAPAYMSPEQMAQAPAGDAINRCVSPDWLERTIQRNARPRKAPVSQPVELARFRVRAGTLAEQLKEAVTTQRSPIPALRLLLTGLTALVEDLRSIGAPDAEVLTLQQLLDELKRFLAEKDHNQEDAAELVSQSGLALQAFAGGTRQTAKRRRSFWK